MLYFYATNNTFDKLWPIQQSAVEKTGIYFAIWVNVEVGLNLGKYYLCRKGFGMSQDHYKLIIGRRDRWSMEQINELEKTYGNRNLKILDAIYRRSGHIIVNLWRIIFYLYVCDN
jgi:hypothetical protein